MVDGCDKDNGFCYKLNLNLYKYQTTFSKSKYLKSILVVLQIPEKVFFIPQINCSIDKTYLVSK